MSNTNWENFVSLGSLAIVGSMMCSSMGKYSLIFTAGNAHTIIPKQEKIVRLTNVPRPQTGVAARLQWLDSPRMQETVLAFERLELRRFLWLSGDVNRPNRSKGNLTDS